MPHLLTRLQPSFLVSISQPFVVGKVDKWDACVADNSC